MRPNREAVSISSQLWDEFFSGSRLACARLLTKAENDPQSVPEIRESLQQLLWDRFAAMTNALEEIRILSDRLVKNGQSPYPFIQAMGSNVRMELVNQRANHENGG